MPIQLVSCSPNPDQTGGAKWLWKDAIVQEIEVIRATRSFLRKHGLLGSGILDMYTDAHPGLLIDDALRPFQRFTLAFDGFSVHPDLVGRLTDGETTFAIEAKGTTDFIKGIAQADIYRAGFHLALHASAGRPPRDLIALARQRDVGVLAVHNAQHVEIVDLPPPHLPHLRYAESVRKQFVTTDSLSRQFYFNIPTHYVCFAPVLQAWRDSQQRPDADLAHLEPFLRDAYPVLPRGTASFRAAIGGAEKLGLVQIQGRQVHPTFIGRTVAALLPDSASLATIHQQIARRGSHQTLASVSPVSGAVLRCLLYTDTVARFIIDVLSTSRCNEPISMRSLVIHCAEHDALVTPTIFFKPDVIADITDERGRLHWHTIQSHHFRSTVFMQYKSLLKHAGILRAYPLGGSTARQYDPDTDLWEILA